MEARHKVLIVDDDPAVVELYRELLSHLPSQPEVFTATSGARALALLKAEPFRLLLCDLKMPKMDGLQVLSICRRTFPDLRTVVVTAVENEEFRSRAYALGVDLFWLKPDTQQNMQMFLQCVEALLGLATDSGFRGVQSKGLLDLLQMECLAQSSTVLRIRRGSLTGQIWISGGELIDAETEGARGELAFRRILSWKSGTFENMPAEASRERTIFKPFNALLLETAQVLDESVEPPATSPDQPNQKTQRNTVWRLASLTRAGADYVVAVKNEPGAKAGGWGTEATEELAEWARQAFDVAAYLSQKLQTGPLCHAEGTCASHRFVLLPHEEKLFLVGWPAGSAKRANYIDATKQLVASWDS